MTTLKIIGVLAIIYAIWRLAWWLAGWLAERVED